MTEVGVGCSEKATRVAEACPRLQAALRQRNRRRRRPSARLRRRPRAHPRRRRQVSQHSDILPWQLLCPHASG